MNHRYKVTLRYITEEYIEVMARNASDAISKAVSMDKEGVLSEESVVTSFFNPRTKRLDE